MAQMTPTELAKMLPSMSPDELAKLPHDLLYSTREYLSPEEQNVIAPYEHQAFAREVVANNPLMALPVAAGTLLYQPYKAVMGARSRPSMDQFVHGFMGIGQGLHQAFSSALQSQVAQKLMAGNLGQFTSSR